MVLTSNASSVANPLTLFGDAKKEGNDLCMPFSFSHLSSARSNK